MAEHLSSPVELNGTQCFISTDRYSNFKLYILTSTTARAVINKLKPHLARYGLQFQTDSPQTTAHSSTVRSFRSLQPSTSLNTLNVSALSTGRLKTVSKQQRSNLKKAVDASHGPHLSLLDFRNTPSEGMDSTPAQRLFSRRTRTSLPMGSHLLQSFPLYTGICNKCKTSHRSPSTEVQRSCDVVLKSCDVVRVRPLPGHSRWFKAQVSLALKSSQEAPPSYQVRT